MHSVLGFNWQQKNFDERHATTICQRFQLSEILSNLLASREISLDEVENFLQPKIKISLPDPFELSDMGKAVSHVIAAIQARKKITIFADYDVDGATSAALLKRFFREIGIEVNIYIPDRILEGYGPNSQALLNLKKNGTDLVITVDCGTVAFKPLEDAKLAGLEIIVIDHHLGVLEKPEAIAVINPNLLNETFPHKNLCAAGVSFLFAVAINKKLRESGFYSQKKEPNLLDLLDLVALGTVCDVMSLTGLNRAFVAQGLKVLKQRKNLGLRKICDLASLDEEPNSYHLGFIIGPRINAGGRIGKSDFGAKILSSEDESEIDEIGAQLEILNRQRKDIEAQVLEEAVKSLEAGINGFAISDPVIFATSKNWHQGVIGIVASRLKDLYNRPVAVIALDEEKGKASCRSIAGIDFGAEILNARLSGLLLDGGGHAMAGGFSILTEKIPALHQFFCENLGKKIIEITAKKNSEFDIALDLVQVNIDLLKELSKLEPFGVGNVRPKFLLRDVVKVNARLVGQSQDHISCVFSARTALGFNGQIQAIAFRSANTPLAQILLDPKFTKPLNLIGSLNVNSWMGVERVQMVIEDILIPITFKKPRFKFTDSKLNHKSHHTVTPHLLRGPSRQRLDFIGCDQMDPATSAG
ncbi:MAG: single-stranded-DNA-specific exonuclease RecJ [Alphaproteobacteria bacterium RIFCSPLOWO2_01_FULL_40_26]|nr:MAG: single-stranded-DNA-specific exonuclease RecJ [Alphaproteobacteria bacterium RIFCSPLOWO2_01_FULL_40_26]OFX10104.1 MAG: single-stranded-DNA-specific exonuclease RecJ [Alphaproteobacteria bacterium RIFCSPLOWO2_02_FULL_40_19]OFX11734.1 MAG: single-stranded-DNA-specific exonuclease RecJ [Alphaproteobacteria bacterium RIFCSPLOWO2_12_FULL_40_11]